MSKIPPYWIEEFKKILVPKNFFQKSNKKFMGIIKAKNSFLNCLECKFSMASNWKKKARQVSDKVKKMTHSSYDERLWSYIFFFNFSCSCSIYRYRHRYCFFSVKLIKFGQLLHEFHLVLKKSINSLILHKSRTGKFFPRDNNGLDFESRRAAFYENWKASALSVYRRP